MISLYKIKTALLSIVIVFTAAKDQNQNTQSISHLKSEFLKIAADTPKINIRNKIASSYKYSEAKEGLRYGNKALALAEKKS
jgi:hypothetical protein